MHFLHKVLSWNGMHTYFSNFSVLVLTTTIQKMLNEMQQTQRNDNQSVKSNSLRDYMCIIIFNYQYSL